MNKIIRTTFAIGMAAFMVTGCDAIQYKQVEYDEWHEKVSNLPEAPTPEKIVVKGKTNDKVIDIVLKEASDYDSLDSDQTGVIIVMALMSGEAMAHIEERANAKYYVGQLGKEGYKLEDEDDNGEHVATWDKYGNLTSYKDVDLSFSAKYTYKKE